MWEHGQEEEAQAARAKGPSVRLQDTSENRQGLAASVMEDMPSKGGAPRSPCAAALRSAPPSSSRSERERSKPDRDGATQSQHMEARTRTG